MSESYISPTKQADLVFDNMSDGVMTVDADHCIQYVNPAFLSIFKIEKKEDILGKKLEDFFQGKKKKKSTQTFFAQILKKPANIQRESITHTFESGEKAFLSVEISLMNQESTRKANESFPGMLVLIENVTEGFLLKQREKDYAYIFAGLVFCITGYLMAWSLLEFTLKIHLKTDVYTIIIEGITFLLFLEIVFCTSFSLRDIGLIPKLRKIKVTLKDSFFITLIACAVMLGGKFVLLKMGLPVKKRFIGGSFHGATNYLLTAFVQEFLARGVIQNCVKSIMHVRHQKGASIILTSLLFSLMHMPFGFTFMVGAFLLSIALGIVFERHENLWGCYILHWACGYAAMSVFF